MARSSCEAGRWIPGVSTKTICVGGCLPLRSGTSTMPWMRVRVVCGLAVTIATFSPMRALINVDLPAFGRPMMETNPERMVISAYRCFRQPGNAQPVHAAVSGGQNLEAEAITLDHFPLLRDSPGGLADEASDGRCF